MSGPAPSGRFRQRHVSTYGRTTDPADAPAAMYERGESDALSGLPYDAPAGPLGSFYAEGWSAGRAALGPVSPSPFNTERATTRNAALSASSGGGA